MKKFVLLSLLGFLTLSATADAAPLVVTAGQVVTINFDLTTATPAPPFAMLFVETGTDIATVLDPDIDEGLWEMFSAPNATGTLMKSVTNLGLKGFTDPANSPGWLDGIVSARFTLTSGSITIDPLAIGWDGTAFTTDFAPSSVTISSVPEPASMLLVATGLFGVGVRRWRRARR